MAILNFAFFLTNWSHSTNWKNSYKNAIVYLILPKIPRLPLPFSSSRLFLMFFLSLSSFILFGNHLHQLCYQQMLSVILDHDVVPEATTLFCVYPCPHASTMRALAMAWARMAVAFAATKCVRCAWDGTGDSADDNCTWLGVHVLC